MTSLVLDASASVELLLDTPVGRQLQAQTPHDADWWVPEHYFVEVAGALRRAELRNPSAAARIAEAFTQLSTAPVHRVQLRPLLADIWKKRANITVADAAYVVLAEHLQATLVTADMKLVNAPGLGIATIHP